MAKKILVADDAENWRDLHKDVLEDLGYRVLVVESSEAASAALTNDPEIYGAVFDNDMQPGKDGMLVLGDIRSGEYGEDRKEMPVLLVFSKPPQVAVRSIENYGGVCLDKGKLDDYEETIKGLFGDPQEVGN